MPTGDGLLARIHPPLGVLTLAQARAVAEGARRFGNGHLDLTARGNLQIRGVSEATTAPLAALLDAAGLGDVRRDGGPQRLTLTGPLAERDPSEIVDIPALARAIEGVGRDVPGLPAKTLVAVGCKLEEADWSVVPLAADRVAIVTATEAIPVTECTLSDAPALLASHLTAFTRTGRRRMREVTAEEWVGALPATRREWSEAIRGGGTSASHGAALDCIALRAMTVDVPMPGLSDRAGLPVLALDAPFGRCTVDAVSRLIAIADGSGAPDIRLSPTRGVVLLPSRPERIDLDSLAADFIVAADDPRRAVAACTGAPACASGSTPTLRDAARVAEAIRTLATGGLTVHVSGCAKGCAKPGPADLTLVGREGAYAIIVGGSPSDPPSCQIPIEAALERLERAANVGLAAAFAPPSFDQGRNRRPA
jgi:precorrin-3B synthase